MGLFNLQIGGGGGSGNKENPISGAFNDFLGGMAGGIGGGVTNQLMDNLFGSDPGADALDYMNKAFPGTTPLERLGGSNGASQVESNRRLAREQFQTQKEIARIGSKAQMRSSENMMKGEVLKSIINAGEWGAWGFRGNANANELLFNNVIRDLIGDMTGYDMKRQPPKPAPTRDPADKKDYWRLYKKDEKTGKKKTVSGTELLEGLKKGATNMTDDVLNWF